MTTSWIDKIDEIGESPLTRASRSGRTEVANLMLIQQANDAPLGFGQLPDIHRAAAWGFEDVLDDLIDDGADVDEMDGQGETPLHKAVRLGNTEAARALIEHGANINAADSLGMTPLHWAALTGNADITDLLLANFANVEAHDYAIGGITPLGIAKLLGYSDVKDRMIHRCTYR